MPFHSIGSPGPATVYADQLIELADRVERSGAGPFMYTARSRHVVYSDPDIRDLVARLRNAGGTIDEFHIIAKPFDEKDRKKGRTDLRLNFVRLSRAGIEIDIGNPEEATVEFVPDAILLLHKWKRYVGTWDFDTRINRVALAALGLVLTWYSREHGTHWAVVVGLAFAPLALFYVTIRVYLTVSRRVVVLPITRGEWEARATALTHFGRALGNNGLAIAAAVAAGWLLHSQGWT